jgi:hypothetical protein
LTLISFSINTLLYSIVVRIDEEEEMRTLSIDELGDYFNVTFYDWIKNNLGVKLFNGID